MANYNIHPDLPRKPSAALGPQFYLLNVMQSKREELLKLEER